MNVKTELIAGFLLASALAGRAAETCPADRVRKVADDVCTVTSVVADEVLRLEFTLRPEPGSNIRCRMELPPPERWDGRMWGVGNSGRAGIFLPISQFAEAGSAVVTTDLGTHDYLDEEQRVLRVWPDCVRRDYDWRATHLMTVYAKRFVEAYYGRPAAKCYFNGGSCGGRQGIGEAIRFPEDYDGVIAHLTGNNPICNEIDDFAIWKHTHDADGNLLFTEADMRIVSDAAVKYRADREERPYAGKILGDPFFSEKDVEGFLALAAEMEPRLGTGDLLERLRRIFLGVVHKGRRMTYGKIPGSYLGREMQETMHAYIPQFLMSRGMEKKDMTWDDLDEFVRIYAPSYNACSDDLDAFRRRGGKLIVTVGLEDQTDPPYAPLAHFERVVSRLGGDLSATMEFYRVFAVPGCAHGGGKGRAMTISPDGPALWRQMTDWRENGRAPERYVTSWKSENLELPVAPYPKRLVQDEGGAWVERTFDRRAIRSVDPYYLQCDTAPWRSCAAAGVPRESVLFLGAHPDDTEGYAGTAFLLREKYDVHVVDLTRGERGLDQAGFESGSTGRRRTAEERDACAFLGAEPHFLCEVDGEACASREAAEALAEILRQVKPRAVFVHWPIDYHVDHMQCAAVLANALRKTGQDPERYFYEVLLDQTANWHPLYRIDISSTMAKKQEMLRKYACQNPNDSLVSEKTAQAKLRGGECTPPVAYAETFTTFSGKPIPGGVLEGLTAVTTQGETDGK